MTSEGPESPPQNGGESSSLTPVLARLAQDWVRWDPNPSTAGYVRDLLDRCSNAAASEEEGSAAAKTAAELGRLFPADDPQRRIGFGTAGLRAAMRPGPLAMNDLTVVQAAQGIVALCKARQLDSPATSGAVAAVVGYDHRANTALQLSSHRFALMTQLAFRQAGLECLLLDGYVATPLVPFAVQHANATVGIMVTASHNPKHDAGYKVYWRDRSEKYCCQIRPPLDAIIAQSICENLEPWVDYGALLEEHQREHPSDPCCGLSRPDETRRIVDAYFRAVSESGLVTGQAQSQPVVGNTTADSDSDSHALPRFCYTAMHGVGHSFAVRAFETFGLPPFVSVPSQQEPDPDFPTVAFPNPEEPGALDLAMKHAREHKCPLVVANDPDADRLAVAEFYRGCWKAFTGDQIGAMLGHWLWQKLGLKEHPKSGRKVAMVASTVSSQMLAEIARAEGFVFVDALTGFKWIGSTAADLQSQQGYRSLFCYEEAIGFCCGDVVYDKDGLTALGVLAELACDVYRRGSTLSQHLQGMYDKYGEFVSQNGYYVVSDPAKAANVLPALADRLRRGGSGPPPPPRTAGGYEVSSVRYLGEPGGYDESQPSGAPRLPTSKSSPLLTLRFANGCVAHLRSSGTEPKFKYYLELKGRPGVARSAVEAELQAMAGPALEELLQPAQHGLRVPSAL